MPSRLRGYVIVTGGAYAYVMPASPPPSAPARSAAVVNAEIRELVSRVALTEPERLRLVELWAEYGDAVAREAELAA